MARGVQSPEKELRFTRSGQAVVFWLMAAVCLAVAVTMAASSLYRGENPALPHPLWAVLPLAACAGLVRLALHLTKHAYLLLSPLGIEIFPFFRPAAGMTLVTWQEIAEAEVDEGGRLLTLHHNKERTSGVKVALGPIRRDRRELLAKAVIGRVEKQSVPQEAGG